MKPPVHFIISLDPAAKVKKWRVEGTGEKLSKVMRDAKVIRLKKPERLILIRRWPFPSPETICP